MAGTAGESAQIAQELTHLTLEAQKAQSEYQKLASEGKLSAAAQQQAAHDMAQLPAAIGALGLSLWKQYNEKVSLQQQQATADLQQRIQAQQTAGFQQEYAAWDDEIAKLTAQYAKKGQLTATNEALIAQIHEAGTEKIRREQLQAYEQELVDLQGHMAQIVTAYMTTSEKICVSIRPGSGEVLRGGTDENRRPTRLAALNGKRSSSNSR